MTEPLPPIAAGTAVSVSRRWWRAVALGAAAAVLLGAGVGIGMAATASGAAPAGPGMSMAGMSGPGATTSAPAGPNGSKGKADKGKGKGKAGKGKASTHRSGRTGSVDPARQAWAHQYGIDRRTMPNLAPVAQATEAQRAAASALLEATEQDTAKYSDLATAKAAGFDLQRSLAAAEKRHPKLGQAIAQVDAGGNSGMPPMLHVGNHANRSDGKVLDPQAPETLMYGYSGSGSWKLIGVMYTANEAYPSAPPDPGGPITRWHYHDGHGGQSLMMHVFFVPGNDLAAAYAAEMT